MHNQNLPIPLIPSFVYNTLNPIEISTILPIVFTKHKAVQQVANKESSSQVKRQQTAEMSEDDMTGNAQEDRDRKEASVGDIEEDQAKGKSSVGMVRPLQGMGMMKMRTK